MTSDQRGLLAIQLVLAYEWFSAGYEKVKGPEFASGIAGTFEKFASGNPFPWYKDYLTGFAAAHAGALAQAVQWGEVAVGIGLAAACVWHLCAKTESQKRLGLWVAVFALTGGMLMSANFYLAAGWTSPSTHGLNLVMFWVQAALVYVWISRIVVAKKAKRV